MPYALLLLFLLSFAPVDSQPAGGVFKLNAGGSSVPGGFVADNANYYSPSKAYKSPRKLAKGRPQTDLVYQTHRWKPYLLAYDIPVSSSGGYTVDLLFSETYKGNFGVGKRVLDIAVEGVQKKGIDVFKSVGADKPYTVTWNNVKPKNSKIHIEIKAQKQNPFISGIIIKGKGAGGTSASTDPDLNGGYNHRAHSVPGGPYAAIDFDGSGQEMVSLNGELSHSHYFSPGPPAKVGLIVEYIWTNADTGKLIGKGATPKASFPVGTTMVKLQVKDNTGDVATDFTKVTVTEPSAKGAVCYYYKTGGGLPVPLNSNPRPVFSAITSTLSFPSLSAFPGFGFKGGAFTARCVFHTILKSGQFSYTVQHTGPMKMYADGQLVASSSVSYSTTTKTSSKFYTAGLHNWQIIYSGGKVASLKLNGVAPSYNPGAVLPVIFKLSVTKSIPAGGGKVDILGAGFLNGVTIFFGSKKITNIFSSSENKLTVEIPPGNGKVNVYVSNKIGASNSVGFQYTSKGVNAPIKFTETRIKMGGAPLKLPQIASATFGPDGKLYLGTLGGFVHVLTLNKNLNVVHQCKSEYLGKNRVVLGLAFNPAEKGLKLYAATSTLNYKSKNLGQGGWTNGKIVTLTPSGSCLKIGQDLITGLPVSNHDHAVGAMRFTKNGQLLIAVGGFTNAGVSKPNDKLGGTPAVPLSGAVIICDTNKGKNFNGKITYSNVMNPAISKQTGGDCRVWAAGLRNAFGMMIHSNGKVYAMDNGHNNGFGPVSTGCGSSKPENNMKDKFHMLSRGQKGGKDAPYFGFPNRNRGRFNPKECVFEGPGSIPALATVTSSTNGLLEYTANTFDFQLKGNIFLSQMVPSKKTSGKLFRVQLAKNGFISKGPDVFHSLSGLSIVMGPYGELIMPQIYKAEIAVLKPQYAPPASTTLIAVSPYHGPKSGGIQVTVTGHNFGNKPTVTFGGKPCTNVVQVAPDGTSLKCTIPPGTGAVPVVVTGAAGKSAVLGADFQYL